MTAAEMIDRRRSVRSYTEEPLTAAERAEIDALLAACAPLSAELPLRYELLSRAEARCTLPMPWLPPDVLATYAPSEVLPLVNVGFVFGKLDLALQAKGLGACWLGLGKPRTQKEKDGLPFAIMLVVGHPKNAPERADAREFRRRPLAEIADIPDGRLEAARLAASAMNGQPWYFTHEGEVIHVFCSTRRSRLLRDMNRIDIGIALAQLATAHPAAFRFFTATPSATPHGHEYIGSVIL